MRIRYRAFLKALLPALVCILLAGCFDTKQDITLNPDGSGKVVIESSFAQTELLLDNGAQNPHEESSSAFVQKLIEHSRGVDTWRDITYRDLDDGRISFRGTAYFRDLSKLKIAFSAAQRLMLTKDASGQLSITVTPDKSEAPVPLSVGEGLETLSLRQERKKFRAMQPWLAATIGSMKCDTTIQLPGVIRQSSNFETVSAQTLRLRFEGARVLRALEELVFDPVYARQRLAADASNRPVVFDHLLNERLYGQNGPLRAVIAPGKPLFDYAAEVKNARQAFVANARELGLNPDYAERPEPMVAGAPAPTKVIGVEWQFGGKPAEYNLRFVADLPRSVLRIDRVQVSRAQTLEGKRLADQGSILRLPPIPPEPRTNWTFEVQLSSPDPNSKGIAEVSGVLECVSAQNLRSVELFSGKIRPGEKGAEFDTSIEAIAPVENGGEKLVLQTRLEAEELVSLRAIDEAGLVIPLERLSEGRMKVGQANTYAYFTRRTVPRMGKLLAQIMSGTTTVQIPFAVTNLTLLGQPRVGGGF